MLAHRLRRWTNIKPALVESLVLFAGKPHAWVIHSTGKSLTLICYSLRARTRINLTPSFL